jgi:DNA (cytosine-5)-methyltransferase 1
MRLLDLFSGIGGFHLGFERAGFEFDYVGFAEVDKYASAVYKYNFPFAEELGDVKSIRPENLPKIDIITFGSPCQDFSIAGKRAGATEGTRSSLIWEAIRLITECKPRIFVWENVKGTFSSNNGADFWAIIQAFTNIGSYRLEWQLLNTRWFLPQNRERLYLVGFTGDRGGRSVFPIGEDDEKFKKLIKKKSKSWKWFQTTDTSSTVTAPEKMRNCDTFIQTVRALTEARTDEAKEIRKAMQKNGKDFSPRRMKHLKERNDEMMNSLTTGQTKESLVKINQNSIRRLTPRECNRLQGFPDNHNEFGLLDGKKVVISDTQRYKQAGNAVTVDVVAAVARKIRSLKLEIEKE